MYLIDFTQVFVSFTWISKHSHNYSFVIRPLGFLREVFVSEFIDQIMQAYFVFVSENYVQSTLGQGYRNMWLI